MIAYSAQGAAEKEELSRTKKFWENAGSCDQEAIERARKINQTWMTKGKLALHTEQYLDHLATVRPEDLAKSCREAIAAARAESHAQRDPKPLFYGTLFSRASKQERDEFLRDHFFTRLLSAEIQTERSHKNTISS